MPKVSSQKPALGSPPPHVHSQSSEYGVATLIGLFFVSIFAWYTTSRSGVFDWQQVNKALADASTVLLGLILLIGTGSRLFSFPDKFIPYRKEIGIIAFLLAVGHFFASLFLVSGKYDYTTLLKFSNLSAMLGLAPLIIMFLLFLSSRQKIMAVLGAKIWWKFQYWGLRLTFALIALHLFVLKWPRWVSWYKEGTTQKLAIPAWPSLDLLIGWFVVVVILIRLSELGGSKFAKAVWYLSFLSLPLVYAATFWWGTYLLNK